MNYIEKINIWEFISIKTNPEIIRTIIIYTQSIPFEFVKKHGGAWFVNVNKESNYNTLTGIHKMK